MVKFEYQYIRHFTNLQGEDISGYSDPVLDKLGEQGWEVVNFELTEAKEHVVLLKRVKKST